MKKELYKEVRDLMKIALEYSKGENDGSKTTTFVKYKGFRAAIRFSDDDDLFVGRVLDIEDIIGFHGETMKEAIEAFPGMIDFHIEICEKWKIKKQTL